MTDTKKLREAATVTAKHYLRPNIFIAETTVPGLLGTKDFARAYLSLLDELAAATGAVKDLAGALIAVEFHACATGDCPHTEQRECTKAFMEDAVNLADEALSHPTVQAARAK